MDLDACVIALPHDLHKDSTIRATESGLDVLCEKPIAKSVDEADEMIESVQKNDALLMVAESARYNRLIEKIGDIIKNKKIGEPVFGTWNDLHKFESWGYENRKWLNDPERAGGGHWISRGIHLISPLRNWFLSGGTGDVRKVFSTEY
ncbi:hypothetical protein AKJ41_03840 [candidate division MSBL1 archaeon SCGC-AAA259O05]|uniref:Gfo/Idh/MocA-like oxidoreductase N-terminal domain-containing protein n=1 Tax=candidate division MSBL1 archaeon SCGC-AAA259O05 TaxID=1698271 RepID=A0A133V2L4_9EURY|nr:hypothetical protein AKJ41_03840 [candidate division MSBL1 archaeon SCGC-AAA259O05]